MANEAVWSAGTEITLEASGAAINNDEVGEAADAPRASTDDAGYPFGEFVLTTAATGWSAAPTAGCVVNLYEQKTDGTTDSPDVDKDDYLHDYIGSFQVFADGTTNGQQTLRCVAPIYREGGKYWLQVVDGGSGTAGLALGWSLKLTPVTYGT